MPDEQEFGFGAIQSPPDERDLVVSSATLERLAGATTLPATYRVPGRPPLLNQGSTPQCVAFSAAYEQNYQDHAEWDRFFNFNHASFFYSIGGSERGAVMRYALERMLNYGYPEADSSPDPGKHQIDGYFQVPLEIASIKRAIMAFGGVLVIGPWWESWTHPIGDNAMLPSPSGVSNGHAWWAVGWDAYGIIGQNSWGVAWGDNGLFRMSWWFVVNSMWEVWKTADEKTLVQIARGVIKEVGTWIRRPKMVLGDDAPALSANSIWGQARKAGIRRQRDGKIVAEPWDKPFKLKGFKLGARHGIAYRPHRWAILGIAGRDVAIPAPLIRLV
jgi:hypothetical protein